MSKLKIVDTIRITKFRFFNEQCSKGSMKSFSNQEIKYSHNFKKNISSTLINLRERKIDFRFILRIDEDLGEIFFDGPPENFGIIHFDGECIMESSEQQEIHKFLTSYKSPLDPYFILFPSVREDILKACYENAVKIAEKNNFPSPLIEDLKRFPVIKTKKSSVMKICFICKEEMSKDDGAMTDYGEFLCFECGEFCYDCRHLFPFEDLEDVGGRTFCKYCIEIWDE